MFALVEWILEGLFSVISLASIVSPRKEFGEYKPGDEVEAKFQGKTYPARLISIGDNKKELESGLHARSRSSSLESGLHPRPRSSSNRKSTDSSTIMPAESGSTRKKQCDLPKPKTSKGTAAKSVQLGKRKYGASPSSGCEETLTATIIDATIQDFFKNTPTVTSTPAKTPEPACMLPKTPEPACVPPKTPEPACVPPKTPEPAETPGHYKRYQTPKYVETSSSDDDTDDDVVLTPLVNVPAVKVPRQLHKDASPCRREECINVKRELAQLREQVGSLEAKNRKLMRINKDLESKCETFNDSELHQQSSCEILDAINQLRPGVVTDRNAAREHKMVELVRGSYVFLYENQLKLANESSKSMSALARHLVDIFFSLDIQKTSNLSGSNGLKALDKTIVDAIVAYSVSCEQFKRQSPAEIRQSLRNKLGCLRAPSRTKD